MAVKQNNQSVSKIAKTSVQTLFIEVRLAYRNSFSKEQSIGWMQRHNAAKAAALNLVVGDPLRKFTNWALNDAFFGARQATN